MAERDDISQRTEQPTPLRLAEARKRGQVARSRDLSGVLVLLAGLTLVALAASGLLAGLVAMTAALLDGGAVTDGDLASLGGLLWASMRPVLRTCGLIWAGLVLAAALAGFVQVGPLVAAERIRPDLSRLSPAAGLRRLLSVRSWFRAGLGIARITAVTAVTWMTISAGLRRILQAPRLPARRLAAEAGGLAWGLGLRVGAVLLVLAVVDYLYQRWQLRQDLKITRRELREDARHMEGSPEIRRHRRQVLRRRHARLSETPSRPARAAGRAPGPTPPGTSDAERGEDG